MSWCCTRLPSYTGINQHFRKATGCTEYNSLPLGKARTKMNISPIVLWGYFYSHNNDFKAVILLTLARICFLKLPHAVPGPFGQLENSLCLAGAEKPAGANSSSHFLHQKDQKELFPEFIHIKVMNRHSLLNLTKSPVPWCQLWWNVGETNMHAKIKHRRNIL